jgi:hypothetical protein
MAGASEKDDVVRPALRKYCELGAPPRPYKAENGCHLRPRQYSALQNECLCSGWLISHLRGDVGQDIRGNAGYRVCNYSAFIISEMRIIMAPILSHSDGDDCAITRSISPV